MSHHWVRPPGGGLCCINCGSRRVCGCANDLNVWTYTHAVGCPLHLSAMPECRPAVVQVLVTSEALMFAERSIPWPDERPYEKTLSEDETHD